MSVSDLEFFNKRMQESIYLIPLKYIGQSFAIFFAKHIAASGVNET